MIAVELRGPNLSQQQVPELSPAEVAPKGEHAGTSSGAAPATVTAQFRPLDPGIVNGTIPAFFIGRNMEGFWIARDARGRIGGIFLLKDSAVSFAKRNSQAAGCATIFSSETIELDLDNNGNPLVAQLGWIKRLVKRFRRRMVAFIGRRGRKGFHRRQ
jgi:hypothetical protein